MKMTFFLMQLHKNAEKTFKIQKMKRNKSIFHLFCKVILLSCNRG